MRFPRFFVKYQREESYILPEGGAAPEDHSFLVEVYAFYAFIHLPACFVWMGRLGGAGTQTRKAFPIPENPKTSRRSLKQGLTLRAARTFSLNFRLSGPC